ncbi:hypothetical protein VW23_018215 [Devosia insulae DS-56]|uniref:Response regulatory domain-containing protein n=1 Tax=Devosia insulae DS-56 TaxID=1116389 RepID=A0A1E5XR36_9HYPH|nr:response regulator [Devosia insulae]OEO31025.1 hypothetical protein VW23_018215 [Devosia insulae DS-56]
MAHVTILVVDDEPLIRLDIAYMLEDLGYQTTEASNADEAMQLLADLPQIAAIVTDVDMPGTMDGRQLALAVRNRWPPCKLIVMSGHHMLTATDLPSGAVFISKPVPTRQLASALAGFGV